MTQKAFKFEQQYCIGCQACVVACNARHGLEPGVYPRKADSYQEKMGGPYLSISCNHCANPACVEICPTGAVQKRADGIVVHDPDVCIGCLQCKSACPYDAPQLNTVSNVMVKCDMCAARQDCGDTPACVLACPMKVISVGELEDFEVEGCVAEGRNFEVAPTGPSIRFVPFNEF